MIFPAMIRKATDHDIAAITGIYERIHEAEAAGKLSTGWLKGVYPTEATARVALEAGDLFVLEAGRRVVAAARINQIQVPEYALVDWKYPARNDEVMVLHTLTVDPVCFGQGHARRFLDFYEAYALAHGCTVLRIDTNAKNATARKMYARRGYLESGIIPVVFNGIPNVLLVCMEKRLG